MLPNCTRQSIVYENVCYKCVPKAGEDREIREEDLPKTEPAIYVCESSRTILERSREHWSSYRSGDKDSHIWRHQDLVHKGEPAEFKMMVVGNHRSALGRQIAEAVRIRRRGGVGCILNLKSELRDSDWRTGRRKMRETGSNVRN